MSKRTPYVILFLLPFFLLSEFNSKAQCGVGYTQAQLNWDYLDYYYNSGSNVAPYGHSTGNYITDTWEQTQKFAIGSNYLTIATSSNALLNPGAGLSVENATHIGELAGYTGEDAQFNPSANGQTITITFNNEVTNANFTLYDIDLNQVISVSAINSLAVPQVVNITTQPGTILTLGGIYPLPRTITANGTALANNLNTGAATISIAGPVKTITLTVTTVGTDAVFWLSDINACVTGSFPNNYHQTGNNQPMTGPVINQSDYFIVTPDNQSVYMLNPANGQCRWLFTDASNTYVNSFGYDPYNHILYYVTDGSASNPQNNKSLKKYDLNTETISTVIADIGTTLGIPTFNAGVESAAASFYNGALYLGIEGGRYGTGGSTVTRETIFWRIDFDGSLNPVNAYQVFSANTYLNGSNTSIHDFGDFIIKDGTLYDFNTARNGTNYSQSKYHHYNLMTGNLDALYNNPGTTTWNGQAGMTWNGNLYYFRGTGAGTSGVGTYDGAGNNGATVNVTVVGGGPAWPGGAGDASENFRPKDDFGDAPATYDPVANSPAAHERFDSIRLGATWDREWVKKGVSGTEDTDDGLSYVPVLLTSGGAYLAQATVYNNSGANATLIGWLDYNGNNIFDAGEASTPITVPSSASAQNFWLSWASTTNTFTNGQTTFLRIRITSAAAAMTTSHATGFFEIGEVEDYQVQVTDFPLSVSNLSFNAQLVNNKYTKLTWSANEDANFSGYEIEKSNYGTNWTKIGTINSDRAGGSHNYEFNDNTPYNGNTYYRLKLINVTGSNKYSPVRSVNKKSLADRVVVRPNPVISNAAIDIETIEGGKADISLFTDNGSSVYTTSVMLNSGTNSIPVSVKLNWTPGNYILRVSLNNETMFKKIMIKR